MKKRIPILFLICFFLLLTTVSCTSEDEKNDEETMYAEDIIYNEDMIYSEDIIRDVQKIYDNVYTDYAEFRRLVFSGNIKIGAEIKDENGRPHFKIEEENYKSAADINALMQKIFTKQYIEQKLQWVLGGENPLYREIDGQLCIAMADAIGEKIGKEISTIEVYEDNHIVFVVTYEYENATYRISLLLEDGKWLIDDMKDLTEY